MAIARALVNRPRMLLCDEPTGNLDSKTGTAIMDLLVELHQREGLGLVLITHQAKLAELADRTIMLEDGQIVTGGNS